MSIIGQIERATQKRVVKLFTQTLGYDYLGNWHERPNNRNIEESFLRAWLAGQYDDALITRAIAELQRAAGDSSRIPYDVNRSVYELLRYGMKVSAGAGENYHTIRLIDWANPEANHFAIAEEVTVSGADTQSSTKRPDIVLYVNGIALGVLELKRSTVSVSEGIRQNLDNQKSMFIRPFFSTMQLVMAGNDTEGLRYGTTETREKYYLQWKEPEEAPGLPSSPLDRDLIHVCRKDRFLELLHDFIVFDAGTKKVCRHNQYFGIRAAQEHVRARKGGIIWHTQGSGKSLTMVWLAKWIRENVPNSRVLIITDRTELDEQIEKVFKGVDEDIHRTKSGADLIARLNDTGPWLLGSLVHKFGGKDEDDVESFVADIQKSIMAGFSPKGDIYVFVDECHRTQSGQLHEAMKAILPHAMFIGFTGTPLLKEDKKTSLEVFGPYIHTYRFDEAVEDGVVLDLRYEARDIDQEITSPKKIDQWFEAKTKGLSDLAKAQLKQRWGTMRAVLSSQSRLEKIVADILMDMELKDRLASGRGNAMLVSGSIYEACKFYELFEKTPLKDKCAIITSYKPSPSDVKGEGDGEGLTERLRKYETYNRMLGGKEPEAFEKEVKKRFIESPGQMKLLIVVDKLLTGFDAPSATYLYIDKKMQDHGLFQAICRVNRLDGDDKEYGHIIDYKDLFRSIEGAITDYTSGAFEGYDPKDVEGLLENRLKKAQQRLDEVLEALRALCEPVAPPRDTPAFLHYFCAADTSDKDALKENEPKRLTLYKLTASLIRAYAEIANDLEEAGYDISAAAALKAEVEHFEKVRSEVKLASGDYVDLKMFEPAMRHLIDTYIRADDSEVVSAFDDMSLVELIVECGEDAIDALPERIKRDKSAVAETIENNVRKLIIDENPLNPKYYEQMSDLLDALVRQRKAEAIDYAEYLAKIVELAKKVRAPETGGNYPVSVNSPGKRALFDNLGQDEALTVAVDDDIRRTKKADWRGNIFKEREVKRAITRHIDDPALAELIFDLVVKQNEY
ncbi:type I restriction endonuclease subunit R [Acetobacter ghanensis]|uniref:Type I restriction enzyme endonuclease subunit n=1 Tax=Acetobacter ghanensis TaxID=431306 RepID=A0A0U5F750_9PROT|nr:HsdR family type I site-specific deoxyribonuclease [Acetobacter ghanensis]NHO40539.1 HsdR family type I site-specific deoxyribonuclease [Acetobacter ghanensis]GBQ50011.1 type I/III endonuclease restriction R subunit [Acetobacter ghanensis DSM 18895]CEF56468.1 type I restriction enzyme, R subunit [Acetobacter ghanensis]